MTPFTHYRSCRRLYQPALLVAAVGVIGLAVQAPAWATDRFVDPGGIDTGICIDQANPCATIEFTLTHTTTDDRVFLAPFDEYAIAGSNPLSPRPLTARGSCTPANKRTYLEHSLALIHDIEIIGGGRACTVIDAQNDGTIFWLYHGASISAMTLINGLAPVATAPNLSRGGAINIYGGQLNVSNATFENNRADFGGAIGIDDDDIDGVTIFSSTFRDNTADTGGGAIYCEQCVNMKITASTFMRNKTDWVGGAVYADTSSADTALPFELTISRSRFLNNTSDFIGGALNLSGYELQTVVKKSVFLKNTAIESNGGAIYTNGSLTIDASTFDANRSEEGRGGAVSVYGNGQQGVFNAYNSTFTRNTANKGGALDLGTETEAYLSASTLLGNLATDPAYGDHITGAWSMLAINHTVIADDPLNPGLSDKACERASTMGQGQNNLVTDGTCGSWNGFNLGVPLDIDPDLTDGLVHTPVHLLQQGSNALDAGSHIATECRDYGNLITLVHDQRGVTRTIDYDGDGLNQCDIGAVEMELP